MGAFIAENYLSITTQSLQFEATARDFHTDVSLLNGHFLYTETTSLPI